MCQFVKIKGDMLREHTHSYSGGHIVLLLTILRGK